MTKENDDALRCADWLQSAVQTYPQMSEDEPGGYASEADQEMDFAAAHIRRLVAENEAMRADVQRFREAASCERDLRQQQERHATALVQQMLEALERMDGWLKVRHMGGLMPEERALTTAAREWLEGKK